MEKEKLEDHMLEKVNGGLSNVPLQCPKCGDYNITITKVDGELMKKCMICGHTFNS